MIFSIIILCIFNTISMFLHVFHLLFLLCSLLLLLFWGRRFWLFWLWNHLKLFEVTKKFNVLQVISQFVHFLGILLRLALWTDTVLEIWLWTWNLRELLHYIIFFLLILLLYIILRNHLISLCFDIRILCFTKFQLILLFLFIQVLFWWPLQNLWGICHFSAWSNFFIAALSFAKLTFSQVILRWRNCHGGEWRDGIRNPWFLIICIFIFSFLNLA